MGINPVSTNYNLTNQNFNKQLAKVGSLLDSIRASTQSAATSNTSEEAEIAFTNPLTSERYIRLQSKGLNNLRSEIIAACEFIPIGNGEVSEDVAQMQFTLGDNNTISVNNVARLTELHRQIRMYIIEATDQVLERVYPDLCNDEFVVFLKTIFIYCLQVMKFPQKYSLYYHYALLLS